MPGTRPALAAALGTETGRPIAPAAIGACMEPAAMRAGSRRCRTCTMSLSARKGRRPFSRNHVNSPMSTIELSFTPEVERETTPIFERAKRVIPRVEWPLHAPYVAAINRLKRERNAVILAHNYQVPEIFHTVAAIVGDSLALAMKAAETDADVIVLSG